MKFAISYSSPIQGVDPDKLVACARHAEDCGFEALYLPEHIVLYPGATFGAGELPPTLPYADPLDCLSFVASATRRILLGTGVLRLLWAGGADGVSFHGEFFSFDSLCSFPKPYGAAGLPIHVGGSSRAAARRAGRRGDGYFPGGALTPDERAAQLELARSVARTAGRDPQALEYTRWGSMGMGPEHVEVLAAQGVTRIVVPVTATEPGEQRDEMSAFAQRLGIPG